MILESYGWNQHFKNQFMNLHGGELQPARVIRSAHGVVEAVSENGELNCSYAGRLDALSEPPPAVAGDWIAVNPHSGGAQIRAILTRRSSLSRRRPGRAELAQVVAANVDIVILVEALDRGLNPRRVERGVALAYGSGAQPLVILSKADLSSHIDEDLARARAAAPFATVVATSSLSGAGLEALRCELAPGTSAVFCGPSGAGKSSLLNSLTDGGDLRIGEVRAGDFKGRHTTTSAELRLLPCGASVIDTPGVRELGLWLEAEELDLAFRDIEALAADCRFRDCRHESEPGCAVLAAVALDELDRQRLLSYHKLRREAELHEARHGARAVQQERARGRSFAKLCRAEKKRKNGW